MGSWFLFVDFISTDIYKDAKTWVHIRLEPPGGQKPGSAAQHGMSSGSSIHKYACVCGASQGAVERPMWKHTNTQHGK